MYAKPLWSPSKWPVRAPTVLKRTTQTVQKTLDAKLLFNPEERFFKGQSHKHFRIFLVLETHHKNQKK